MFGTSGYDPIPTSLPALRQPASLADATPTTALAADGAEAAQFTLYQFIGSAAEAPIADLHALEPKLKGSDDKPDVQVSIELLSFHVADSVARSQKVPQATLRLDMSKHRSSQSPFDPVYWSIVAGLDVAQQVVSQPTDLSKAFRQQPITIAGGLAELRIEVVAHPQLAWWQQLFALSDHATVRKLVSTIGFPGIALDAVKMLDTMLNTFTTQSAQALFSSRPLTVALTQRAATDFSAGITDVAPAILNDGIYFMLRHDEANVLTSHPPLYLGGTGQLVEKSKWNPKTLKVDSVDRYSDLNYAVLRVRTREMKIETMF